MTDLPDFIAGPLPPRNTWGELTTEGFYTACTCRRCTEGRARVAAREEIMEEEEFEEESEVPVRFPYEWLTPAVNFAPVAAAENEIIKSKKEIKVKPDFIIANNKITDIAASLSLELPEFFRRFKAQLEEQENKEVYTLPRGCRFHIKNDDIEQFVIEVAPAVIPLTWNSRTFVEQEDRYTASHTRTHKVAMPWQYFILTFNSDGDGDYFHLNGIQVMWAGKRLNNIDGVVFPAPIPNMGDDSFVCMGTTAPESIGKTNTERAEQIVSNFYSESSVFNSDLGWNVPDHYMHLMRATPLSAIVEW